MINKILFGCLIFLGVGLGSSLEARTHVSFGVNVVPQVQRHYYPCYVEEYYPCETVIIERPYCRHVHPGYRAVPVYPVYRERVMVAPIPSFSFNFFR